MIPIIKYKKSILSLHLDFNIKTYATTKGAEVASREMGSFLNGLKRSDESREMGSFLNGLKRSDASREIGSFLNGLKRSDGM